MHADLLDQHGKPMATWALDENGVAVLVAGDDGSAVWGEPQVTVPGPRLVKPEDGQLYLEGLEFAYRSPYCRAVFHPDDDP